MRHLQSLLACALLALAALACAWPALDKSSLFTAAGSTTADTPQQTATVSGQSLPEGWTVMPAGARSTYLGISHGGSMLLAGRAQRSMPVLYVLGDRLAAMPQGLQGLQPFGLSDKPLSIEGNISLPPRRNPAARSYRLHIDPRYLDPRH